MSLEDLRGELTAGLRRELEQTRDDWVRELLAHIGESGAFNPVAYTRATNVPGQGDDLAYFSFAGHAVEALMASPAGALSCARFHRFVQRTTARCLASDIWADPRNLTTAGAPRGAVYAGLAHLVHGVKVYCRALEERTPPG